MERLGFLDRVPILRQLRQRYKLLNDPTEPILSPEGKAIMGDKDLKRNMRRFYHAVSSTGRFTWMGLVKSKDELQRTIVGVYLLEDRRNAPNVPSLQPEAEFIDSYTDLALGLQSHHLFLNLYYLDAERLSVSGVVEYFERRKAESGGETDLVWSEPITSKST